MRPKRGDRVTIGVWISASRLLLESTTLPSPSPVSTHHHSSPTHLAGDRAMAAAAPPPAAALEQLSKTKMFGGHNLRFRHQSASLGCPMTFSLFLPASPASKLPVRALPRSPRYPTPRPRSLTALSSCVRRCCTGSPASPAPTRTSSSSPAPSAPPRPTA